MAKKKKIDFKYFCRQVERLVINPVDIDELNDLYVWYKEGIKDYYTSPSEFIRNYFRERTLDTHRNALKNSKIQ